MPENFDFLQDNKYEVGSVRNFLVSARVNSERKEYTAGFHAVFALVLSLLMYLAVDGAAIGFPVLFSSLLVFVLPPLYVFTFLYAPPSAKLMSVILPLLLFGIRVSLFENGIDIGISFANLFTYSLCILCSAVLTKCVISGYTKNVAFILLTVCYALIFVCEIAYLFIYTTGSFNLAAVSDSIKALFDNIAGQLIAHSETDPGFEQLKAVFSANNDITRQQLAAVISETFDYTFSLIKGFIPSIVAVICMIRSFITIGIFTRVASFFKIDVFVCITDLKWSYRPSMLTTKIYDIVFVIFIITMFVNLPANISAAIINLFVIMTPLVFAASVRCIYRVLQSKMQTPVAAKVITGVIIAVSVWLLGFTAFFIISSIGITFIRARDREEKKIIPIKIVNDMQLYETAFMGKTRQESDDINTEDAE